MIFLQRFSVQREKGRHRMKSDVDLPHPVPMDQDNDSYDPNPAPRRRTRGAAAALSGVPALPAAPPPSGAGARRTRKGKRAATEATTEAPEAAAGGQSDGALDVRVLKALRQIIQAIDVHSRRLSALYHVTAPQLVCLLTIVERGPITSTALAHEVHLSASTIVGILDRLEAGGYIRRERGTTDRRRVYLTATDDGRQFAQEAPSPLQAQLAERLSELTDDEQRSIARGLERVVVLMGADRLEGAPLLDTTPSGGPP